MTEHVYLYVYGDQSRELRTRLHAVQESDPKSDAWSASLRRDDARLRQCLSLIHDAGLKPWNERWRPRRRDEFLMEISWKYTKRDIETAVLLELGARYSVDCWEYEASQVCGLWRNQRLKKSDGVACAVSEPAIMFVPDTVRVALEREELSSLVLRPTVQFNKAGKRWSQDELITTGEMWWELTSSVRLPPMLPSLKFRDYLTGKPYDDAASNSCGIDADTDGFCRAPRLRYRRTDLAEVPEFDIARTHERFGMGAPHVRGERHRATIVSQRFRQVCLKHKIRADFVPVEIE